MVPKSASVVDSDSSSETPDFPLLVPKAERPSQQNARSLPTRSQTPRSQIPRDPNASITPPTLSPLSPPAPTTNEAVRARTPNSPTPQEAPKDAQPQRQTRGRVLERPNSPTGSDSSLSSIDSYYEKQNLPIEFGKDGKVLPHDHRKKFIFTPFFKRPGFRPQPEITGNEAWASNRVWNSEKKKYEVVNMEAVAKH